MLTKLNIQNYALIEDVSIDFKDGFTTISGETGAGKSILLGGLGLILGNRADTNTLMNPNIKCIIEGDFNISNYNLQDFFKKNDLDYEEQTIIRRELLPSGKSRAFVNDTPVRLSVLSEIKTRLIDVHSQHQTLQLNDVDFQFNILDAIADNKDLLFQFAEKQTAFNKEKKEYKELQEQIRLESEQHDYHLFLYDELEKANFKLKEQERIENEIERLNNIEVIVENLSTAYQILSDEEMGVQTRLFQVKQSLKKIKSFSQNYAHLAERLESVFIEIADIESELSNLQDYDDFEVNDLEKLNTRLQLLYHLFQKHQVTTIAELMQKKDALSQKVERVTDASNLLETKKTAVTTKKKELKSLGEKISKRRKNILQKLEKDLALILHELGMPNALFSVKLNPTDSFFSNGIDEVQFLFTANKGGKLKPIKQVASGGELSRIMLAVKSVMAVHSKLPTVIFDEIDSGISGEIAIKMANIMSKMAKNMQVIAITHLPQIVAKGKQHLRVYKYEDNQQTKTNIKLLTYKERLREIAEMLGGKQITETALNHAKQLLTAGQ